MEFRILGGFGVVSDAGEPVAVNGRLVRGLIFALICYRNESLSPARLIDLLWGPEAETDRTQSLRSCLWGARKALSPERLVGDDRGHRLWVDPGRDAVDVDRFRLLHGQGRAALEAGAYGTGARALDEALGLWGAGDLAHQVCGTPGMLSLVTGLEEEYRDARDGRIQARLVLGRHRELLPELRMLVTAEPASERLWGHLMLALHRCGLKADALRVFAEAATALEAHAGAGPGSGLRTLRGRIQADDPALKPARTPASRSAQARWQVVPRQLPSDLGDFTGRAVEAAELIGLLSPSGRGAAVRVAGISGPPGIGKSALAVHVGHAVAHDYPDGQLYVRLSGASPTPQAPSTVLGVLLRTLGVVAAEIPETTSQRAALYRSRLAGRRMLIVVDDAASPEQVRPLIPGVAGCAVILTSQIQLTGLTAGALINLEPLGERDALSMLARTIGQKRLDAEPGAAADIVKACGGIPLAVRLAAERLASRPAWPIAYLSRALADERHRLDELVVGDVAMRASIASSYQMLPTAAGRLFRLLTVVNTPEIPGWVADVAADGRAGNLLAGLVDHCLLVAGGVDALGQPRYRFHDLLREYATELLDADCEAADARDRVLAAWVELADRADAVIPRALYVPLTARPAAPTSTAGTATRQRVAAAPLGWFAAEHENLLAAVEAACAAGLYGQGRELALRTASYLHMHSYHEQAERMWTCVAEAAERAGEDALAARARLRAAVVIAADRGHHARAIPLIDHCTTVFEREGDRPRTARAYGLRCFCSQSQGQLSAGRADGEHGLTLARQAGDVHAEFFCLRMLTTTYGQLGHHREAIACAEQTLTIAGDLNSDTYRCAALYTLIRAHLLAGRPQAVIDLNAEGMALCTPAGHELARAHFRQQTGLAYQQLHRHENAIEMLSAAAADFTARRDRYQTARCLRALADSYQATGHHDQARRHLNESIAAFRALDLTDAENEARETLGHYRAHNA
ncbi:BTAD domain-containing putative transcriptional regulator [Actinoallomurus bryophytorum]|uniref:DNA-binding SARP family transcriptional activator n=1 Tax=Actinoallomurus bryophytorum TaxID=1490222 RepID=A0A543CHL5_9ACTN|nr:BTAD domain-containing putative transcriptional regulator [Actinoallomurus bryophytorum]TQL96585.1 DNA-binding SARP family transcriptional activator [Actinoallomurus bryophytorum]